MISLLVPSRKRIESLMRMWDSACDLAIDKNNIEMILAIDKDDIVTAKYILEHNDDRIKIILQPRDRNLSRLWNQCSILATGDIMMHCGDDIVFRTNNWDKIVTDSFDRYNDKIVFVYGKDGINDQAIGTHGFLHRNWVNTLGYFVPPYFSADFNDLWLTDVARKIDRLCFINELYTEHMHFMVGKSGQDEVYRERREMRKQDNCEMLYISMDNKRFRDAAKLIEFMRTYGDTI